MLWKSYTEGKQTQQQIANKIGKSRWWVNQKLAQTNAQKMGKNTTIKPQATVIIIDTTYFEQFGLMVFRSSHLRQNILWYKVQHETNQLYHKGIQELMDDGWQILAIVADGKPGIKLLFPDIPFQLCQFHQFATVTRYISKNPKLEAGKDLRDLMFFLKEKDQKTFSKWLQEWHDIWQDFLNEKTINPISKKSVYTHDRLRSAYRSLKRNLPDLFTFEQHKNEFKIPKTTNAIDGYFGHLKSKINVHRGASKATQMKLIERMIFE